MERPRHLLQRLPGRASAFVRGQQARARVPQRAPSRAAPGRQVVPVRGVQEVLSELKKVTWPTREQATNLTLVVVVVSVAVGLLLGGADVLFYWLVNDVLLKIGAG